ncbi:acyl-CoA thioesterase domain-containing protein [Yinghuangia soli]|uniref:Thioesterase family protein n=1 Tax=Yinghuangia soli TaxID=2908204 RepID=A0AA41PUY9_9ACTN|nr:acyl-CoA thioesterase domain-containing protein [Yinghuangia soli]MCF2525800.1 thioesterase family protein [Yinghuangia soli]
MTGTSNEDVTADSKVATPLGDLLIRADAGGRLSADLSDHHCINGRGFGGWTAALAALAAARSAGGKQLSSCHVVFSGAAVPGELEFSVLPLVEGRTAAAYQVTMHQSGKPVLGAQCWFADPSMLAPAGPASDRLAGVPPVAECPRLGWIDASFPFLGGFAEWAIEYPLSADEFDGSFRGGGDTMSVWIAPAQDQWTAPGGSGPADGPTDGLAERLTDLMILDTHLMDAALRGTPGASMLSLDLAATWYAAPRRPGLTYFAAEGRAHGLLAATSATLIEPDGTLRASGTSNCRVYPRPDPASDRPHGPA